MMRSFAIRAHNRDAPLRRREFIMAFASAVLAAPLAARAQQRGMPLIGFLDTAAATITELPDYYEGLRIEGYIRNQTVALEYRSADGDYGRLPLLAADLINRGASLIAAIGVPAALAAKNATATIPIVFAVGPDPVEVGLIPSLDKPSGNITGVADMAVGREQYRLALLHALLPAATVVAVLINPDNPRAEAQARDTLSAAGKAGLQINVIRATAESDFAAAFAALAESRASGLVIGDDELFISRSVALASLALQHAVPAIFQGNAFARAGGLMSYGSNLLETYHQAGVYSGLILKGAAPANLPVYQSTRTEFIINAKTAAALKITVPLTMLSAAHEVIQ